MTNEEMRRRTVSVCLRVLDLLDEFPNNTKGWVIGKQLVRSSSSVAANYRAACCSRSKAEFFSKMSIVVEEADETVFWLETTRDAGILKTPELTDLINDAQSNLKIFSAARKTIKESSN